MGFSLFVHIRLLVSRDSFSSQVAVDTFPGELKMNTRMRLLRDSGRLCLVSVGSGQLDSDNIIRLVQDFRSVLFWAHGRLATITAERSF